MADSEDQAPSKSLGSRLRGALGKARQSGAASLRVAQRTVAGGVAEAGERLKSGQAAVGHAVEARRIVKQAQEAQQRGNHAMAFRLLEEHLGEHGADPKYVLAMWAAAIACEQTDDAVPAMKKLVRKLTGSGKLLRAAEIWLELEAGVPGALVDPGSLVRIAPALLEDGQKDRAIEALRQALDPNNVALSPGLAVRVAEMARELDPRTAVVAARRALENPDLPAAKRERLQALGAELEEAAAKAPVEKAEASAAGADAEPAAPRSPQPPAPPAVEDLPDLDAEALAREIGSASPDAALDEAVSQRFVDLGEGDDVDLDLGSTPDEAADADLGNEQFVELSGEPAAAAASVGSADAGDALSIEASAPAAAPTAAEPQPRLEPDPDRADDPFDAGGLDLGALDDEDLGLPDGEELGGAELDLELTMPDAAPRDLAEETVFDGGDLDHFAEEAEGDADAEVVALDPEEIAALDADDLPLLDALDAGEPLESAACGDGPFADSADAPDGDPFAPSPEQDAESIAEVRGEHTGEVLAEDPSALDDIATPVVEAVESVAPAARFSEVKVMEGAPKELGDVGIVLDLPGGRRGRVEYAKIEAVAVAEVGDLAAHPVVVVDLLMNWSASGDATLRAVRLRSDGFDPCAVVEAEERPAAAFRAFLAGLVERSGAVPLPNAELRPERFEDLETYERAVLGVGG